jgi:hypothetical protein
VDDMHIRPHHGSSCRSEDRPAHEDKGNQPECPKPLYGCLSTAPRRLPAAPSNAKPIASVACARPRTRSRSSICRSICLRPSSIRSLVCVCVGVHPAAIGRLIVVGDVDGCSGAGIEHGPDVSRIYCLGLRPSHAPLTNQSAIASVALSATSWGRKSHWPAGLRSRKCSSPLVSTTQSWLEYPRPSRWVSDTAAVATRGREAGLNEEWASSFSSPVEWQIGCVEFADPYVVIDGYDSQVCVLAAIYR